MRQRRSKRSTRRRSTARPAKPRRPARPPRTKSTRCSCWVVRPAPVPCRWSETIGQRCAASPRLARLALRRAARAQPLVPGRRVLRRSHVDRADVDDAAGATGDVRESRDIEVRQAALGHAWGKSTSRANFERAMHAKSRAAPGAWRSRREALQVTYSRIFSVTTAVDDAAWLRHRPTATDLPGGVCATSHGSDR